jgi:aspartyl protease family protein
MDFRIVLACVLMAGAAVGLASPGGPLDRQADTAVAIPESGSELPRLATAQVDSGWASAAVLEREGDGHFYADVVVDGQSFRMLVDTGASVIALTGADAEAMGLTWHDDEVRPVAQGASGPVEGVNATISRVALGDHEASEVQAIIIPEGLAVSLLGQSFLGTLGSVRIADGRMILES